MRVAFELLGLVLIVGVVAGLSRRFSAPAPLVLVVVGVVVSFIPGVPRLHLDPNVVLIGLLPPLLYASAIRTSLVSLRRNKLAIASLSVGLVWFSTVVVGIVAWAVVPAVSLAAGLALGAVVAPPDAVAAAAVSRRVAMPRRIVTLLEDESLLNDAAALVALNVTIAALTRNIGAPEVVGRFVLAVGGGVLVGLAAAFVVGRVRARLTDPVLDTSLSFAAPYVAFLPAQAIDASGVLAVVVAGLVLGRSAPLLESAQARLSTAINWRTIEFLLENTVFLLIGLQLRALIQDVDDTGQRPGLVVAICLSVLATAIVARAVWVAAYYGMLRAAPRSWNLTIWPWRGGVVVAWAGMRGVVTLAAVFLLPATTPGLPLLRLAAFSVVAGTLLVQGLSLPWLVRRLRLPAPDVGEDALQQANLISQASQAGLDALDATASDGDAEDVLARLRARADSRANAAWERLGRPQADLETPTAAYRRLRMIMLDAERRTILTARDSGVYDDEILRNALQALDLEESLLDRAEDAQSRLDDDLLAPPVAQGDCKHLRTAPRVAKPRTPGECEDCLREDTTWVHLRMCLTCGQVGCCDSSVGRHAERHFHETGHPVMRSVEPGEAWRWCYVDRLLG